MFRVAVVFTVMNWSSTHEACSTGQFYDPFLLSFKKDMNVLVDVVICGWYEISRCS